MTCAEVREQLTEHALGLLRSEDAGEIDRHLRWCAGCRKESAELVEGVASLALSIPPADPPLSLDDSVVERVSSASGRGGRRGRRAGIRVLAATALAAALLAGGALQWGITQRKQAETLNSKIATEVRKDSQTRKSLEQLVTQLQRTFRGTGTLYQANLFPISRREEGGTALIYSAPNRQGWILVDVVAPMDHSLGPFTVNLVSATGRRLEVGTITQSKGEGDYVRYWPELPGDFSRPDAVELSQVTSIEVIDRFGAPLITGTVHQYLQTPPSP